MFHQSSVDFMDTQEPLPQIDEEKDAEVEPAAAAVEREMERLKIVRQELGRLQCQVTDESFGGSSSSIQSVAEDVRACVGGLGCSTYGSNSSTSPSNNHNYA